MKDYYMKKKVEKNIFKKTNFKKTNKRIRK